MSVTASTFLGSSWSQTGAPKYCRKFFLCSIFEHTPKTLFQEHQAVWKSWQDNVFYFIKNELEFP